ncbi:MAG: hypothetical protein WC875_04330 [Candidatus Absconditabacterales bacterium]
MPIDFSDKLIDRYVEALKKEIDHYSETLTDKEITTLYIGGGTPSRIGSGRIIDIIDYLGTKFNLENLAEFSIELNPSPAQEVLEFVKTLNKRYAKFPRLRYSFGIQSFDDEVLQTTGRAYNFSQIADFLRELVKHKEDNVVFNFDFIAFGKFQVSKNGNKQLRHEFKRDFFQKFLESGLADSISLYTLEGVKDKLSDAGCMMQDPRHGTDDEIMEEFIILKDIILNAGFARYEISNFAKRGKASIHNMVYRNMENYIGLGLSASSFLMQNVECRMQKIFPNSKFGTLNSKFGTRRTNTGDIKQYLEGHRVDEQQVQTLNESDLLIEEFFLRLRTNIGIGDISKFESVLVPNYEGLITNYKGAGLIVSDGTRLQLTDSGMNVYNTIIIDLLQQL